MITKKELKKKGLKLIPIEGLDIQLDKKETIGYDLTVEDYFTFATHDGIMVQDCIAVYIPISEKATKEIEAKILITNNLDNPSNGKVSTPPSQDIILGIYMLTSNGFPTLNKKIMRNGIEITKGEDIFNDCFPYDYPIIYGKQIKEKELMIILNNIKNNYDNEVSKIVFDNVKRVGFKYATLYGVTMSLDDCIIEDKDEIQKYIYEDENVFEQLKRSSDDYVSEKLKERFKYSYMVESGARGNWTQIKQLVLTRGFISNFSGEILKKPIKGCLIDGLTPEEFFYSTHGCRKGLMDIAVSTGVAGYLSRKLVFTCANLQIDDKVDDCGTTDYLDLFVEDMKKAISLEGRYYLNQKTEQLELIGNNNYKDIIGETILLRSPIFCKNEKLCVKCYGEIYKKIHTRFVGIVAAQTLGERGVQLILRTFHTSGSATFDNQIGDELKDTDVIKQQDIIADLSSVSKILHDFKNKNYKDIVNDLYNIYAHKRDIFHIHFECVVSQLIWNNNKKWRLLENRDSVKKEYYSVQSTPSHESWILGLSFSNPRKHILKGILNEGNYKGIFDKILLGEEFE